MMAGEAHLTDYAIERLLEGRLARWFHKVVPTRRGAQGVLVGNVALRIARIQNGRVKVNLELLEAGTGETLIEFNGAWLREDDSVTFESNNQVVIVARVGIT